MIITSITFWLGVSENGRRPQKRGHLKEDDRPWDLRMPKFQAKLYLLNRKHKRRRKTGCIICIPHNTIRENQIFTVSLSLSLHVKCHNSPEDRTAKSFWKIVVSCSAFFFSLPTRHDFTEIHYIILLSHHPSPTSTRPSHSRNLEVWDRDLA